MGPCRVRADAGRNTCSRNSIGEVPGRSRAASGRTPIGIRSPGSLYPPEIVEQSNGLSGITPCDLDTPSAPVRYGTHRDACNREGRPNRKVRTPFAFYPISGKPAARPWTAGFL